MTRTACCVAVAGAVLAAAAGAAAQDDDLAVVKKAVRTAQVEPPAGPGREEPPTLARPPRSGEPRWFKVRIEERGHKRTSVKVNLPIGVVRALEDWPIDLHCHHGARVRVRGKDHPAGCASIRLGDVLAGLQAGQELVQIDSDDATVRVWLE